MASELPEGFTSMDEEYPEDGEEVLFCFRNGARAPGVWHDFEQETNQEDERWEIYGGYVELGWDVHRRLDQDNPDFPIGWRPIKG